MYDKNHDCQPTDDPAPQPNPPLHKTCDPHPGTKPPELIPPEKCPDPDPCCNCPTPPGSTSNCLEDLIAKKSADIQAAEQAKEFEKALKTFLDMAKAAAATYNRDAYTDLVKDWVAQDLAIAELVRKLVCAVKCWKCILDCYVCPILNDLRYKEGWLYNDGPSPESVYNLHDFKYWLSRDHAAKQRRFDRITKVLEAWGDPAGTIRKVLDANAEVIKSASDVIGSEPGKAIYPVFFELIPRHLAIAPPAGSAWTTRIDKEFTEFCECDTGTPDDCCGPDVGETSLRQQLVGPQPYLIDPGKYFDLICCLVDKRYGPAMEDLSKVSAELAAVTTRITNTEDQLKNGLANFAQTASGAIPSVIDCCDYDRDKDDDEDDSSQAS